MKKICAMVLTAALALGCAGAALANAPARQLDVVSLGDSIARGHGCPNLKSDSYGSQLVQLLKDEATEKNIEATVNYKNYGVDGLTADEVYDQITQDEEIQAALKGAELVTVSIGGNNLLRLLMVETMNAVNKHIDNPADRLTAASSMEDIIAKLFKDGQMTEIAQPVLLDLIERISSADFIDQYEKVCDTVIADGNRIVDYLYQLNPNARILVTNIMRFTNNTDVTEVLDAVVAPINEAIDQIGKDKKADVQIVDSFAAFRDYAGPEDLTFVHIDFSGATPSTFDPHPNPLGHTVMAQAHLPLAADLLTKAPAAVLGDVDGSGKISGVDALWVLESVAATRNLDDTQKLAADVNGDTRITGMDALWILEYVAGTRTDFTK